MIPISALIAAIVARVPPVRVQRKRSAGWRMPPNTIYVGRPGPWGNPFVVGKPGGVWTAKVMNRRHAWQLYIGVAWQNADLVRAARAELRGKNLACWCPLPEPYEHDCCHAAVLLAIANSDDELPAAGLLKTPCSLSSSFEQRDAAPKTSPTNATAARLSARPAPREAAYSTSPIPEDPRDEQTRRAWAEPEVGE